ncbi:MAG: GNAT family N-acetyltransferase [Bacillota bacterium]
MYVVNRALAERLEASEAAHWGSLMEGLRTVGGYDPDLRRFGPITALTCRAMAERSFVNRLMGVRERALQELSAAADWFRERGVVCRVDLCPLLAGEETLAHLRKLGFVVEGFQMALFSEVRWVARPGRRTLPPGVEIRLAQSQADLEFAARAMPVAFDSTGEPWLTWLTDSMRASFTRPDWRTYVALVDGEYAGFGQLHLADGVGSLALAGTLPQFRGRGVQTALIHRRIDEAAEAGCDLIAAQTGNGTVSQWNMERVGMRIAYTKAEFYRR